MFQLIISILAILLAVALAGIAVFYGADAFTGGKARADATTIINQASQIEAAMTLYNSQNKGQLDVGGRTGYNPETDKNGGLFEYLTAEGNEYLKEEPTGTGGVWELKCVDNTKQDLFQNGADGVPANPEALPTPILPDAGENDPASCGVQGVALTLNGVESEQCNLINVLLKYEYQDVLGNNPGKENTIAIEDGYVPVCNDEPNAPCCDTP